MMSAAGGGGLDVDEVFSTYLYEGNSSTQTITNGIDLDGEGGLAWLKARSGTVSHKLLDTEVGLTKARSTDATAADITYNPSFPWISSFNTDGFTLGYNSQTNFSGTTYTSWTFRKAPKFFTCLTYSGDGTNGRQISHNLGSVPGMILIKRTDSFDDWRVFHRSESNKYAALNTTFLFQTDGGNIFGNPSNGTATAPTSTNFTVANDASVNFSGGTYVAYLFAHNDGDGEFGPDGDQDIIKCGSYTGNGSSNGPIIDLGFEPQWLLVKSSSFNGGPWYMVDTMRGFGSGVNNAYIYANGSNSEFNDYELFRNTAQGFQPRENFSVINGSGQSYIYMAIRRGSLFPPESATDVFTPLLGLTSASAPPLYQATHTIDAVIEQPRFGDSAVIIDRLRATGDTGKLLKTATNGNELGNSSYTMDFQTGAFNKYSGQATWYVGQCFRRAPGFFDMVAYTGDGTANQTFNHGLTVKPGMIWLKNRGRTGTDWFCWVDDSITTNEGRLNTSGDFGTNVIGTVTDTTVQTLYTGQFATNYNGDKYIAYLFATLDGISKCGSYTGNGTSGRVIDCGFSSAARFILIKGVDVETDWYVWDSARGIVSGNDGYLLLNSTSSENTNTDTVDPNSSGFSISDSIAVNGSGYKYIFYAIA